MTIIEVSQHKWGGVSLKLVRFDYFAISAYHSSPRSLFVYSSVSFLVVYFWVSFPLTILPEVSAIVSALPRQ
jgi:hypothetical protein